MIKRHLKFLVIISLALIVRLFFASFSPFKSDMDSFIAWGEQMLAVGPGNFYKSGIWSDYAPGYMYFMWLVAAIKNTFFSSISREGYEFLHKLVPIVFDILTGAVLYRIMRVVARIHPAEKLSLHFLPEIVMGVYLFSPFTILTGAVWGQVDSVYVFFLVLSFYYIILKKMPLACAIYVVAAVIKPQAVVIAPLYLLIMLKERNWSLFFRSVLISIASFYILTMPFFGLSALQGLWSLLQNSINVYPYSSINTFNFWGTMGFWKSDAIPLFLGATARQIGYVLWGASLIFGFYYGLNYLYSSQKKMSEKNAAVLAAFFIFSAVMFMTRMHERYLFPLFAYFILAAGIYSYHVFSLQATKYQQILNATVWVLYALTMVLHTLNLYYVYIYYLYFLQEPRINVPAENTFYYFVESLLAWWSYLQVAVYLVFIFIIPSYIKRFAHHSVNK